MNPRLKPLLRAPRLPKGYQGVKEVIPFALKYRLTTIAYILTLFVMLLVATGVLWMVGLRDGIEIIIVYMFLLILWYAWEDWNRQGIRLICMYRTEIIFDTFSELFTWTIRTGSLALTWLIIELTIIFTLRVDSD
jgi:hypothetical protein